MPDAKDIRALSVVLTAQCNLRCAYCYQDRRPARHMDWGTLRQAIDLLLSSRQSEVTLRFYGGEPLLELPLLRRAVHYAGERCPPPKQIRFGVSTNGLLLDDTCAAFLARHRVETQISFDGVPGAQDQRRPGTYPKLDGLLDRLRERHLTFFTHDLTVALTLTAANLPTLAESIEYFIGKDVRSIFVGPILTHDPDWKLEHIHELDRQLAHVLRSSLRLHRATGRVPLELFHAPGDSSEPGSGAMCRVGRNGTLVVDVDGQAMGCLLFAGSYQSFPSPLLRERVPGLRLGSLGDPALPDRLRAYPEALRAAGLFDDKAGKHSRYGPCRPCPHLHECSACPVSIGHIPGNTDPSRVSDLVCAFHRVASKYRAHFVRQTTGVELLSRVLIPDLARRLTATTPSRERSP